MNKKLNKKAMALTQTFLLILGIMAFAFIIGSEFKMVHADDPVIKDNDTNAPSLVNPCKGKIDGISCGIGMECFSQSCILSINKEYGDSISQNSLLQTKEPTPQIIAPSSGGSKNPITNAAGTLTTVSLVLNTPAQLKKAKESFEKLLGKVSGDLAKNQAGIETLKKRASEIGVELAKPGITDVDRNSLNSELSSVQNSMKSLEDAAKPLTGLQEEINKKMADNIGLSGKALKEETKKWTRDYYEQSTSANVKFFEKFKANFFEVVKNKESGYSLTTGGYIIQTAAVTAISAAVVSLAFNLAGAGKRNMNQINSAAFVSAAAVTTVMSAIRIAGGNGLGFGWSAAIVVGATLIWTALTYQDFTREVISYNAGVWQPAKGGEKCQECNDLPYGCSEYQCHTYGAGCEIINPGTSYQLCDWKNSRDFNPPLIAPLDDYLDYNFEFERISSDSVKLIYTGQGANEKGCIPAFTGVKFGVKTDEPAQCKIDLDSKYAFSEMSSFLSEGSVHAYNHTIQIPSSAYPSSYSLNEAGWYLETGLTQNFFIRCEDVNGNSNPTNFLVTFCVDDGPDTTPPQIETNYLDEAYVRNDVLFIDDLEVYTNEPADCKWDFFDKEYDDMDYDMSGCSEKIGDYTFPKSYRYGCFGNLTGISSGKENLYYIRCKDKPDWTEASKERRITNEESYIIKLIGTNKLAISAVALNDLLVYEEGKEQEILEFMDSTSPVTVELKVKTSQGAQKDGKARCSYKSSESNLFYEFYNNGVFDYLYENTHNLYLYDGDYNYEIKCCDIAQNCDVKQINFKVETDTAEPEISRAYYEDAMLKLITNEPSECVYSTSTCDYLIEDGLSFQTNDNEHHYVNWNTQTDLFVKCKDKYGNPPDPAECQIVVRAYNEYVKDEN